MNVKAVLFVLLGCSTATAAADPPYEVRLDKTVMVPMRDGVELATDLYFPEEVGGKLPVVLIRTPYDKNTYRREGSEPYVIAGNGYVVAVQDVRGKFESEGDYVVSAADRNDGYDTLTWLAEQPWSNGKIGTYGCSYLGENQMMLAAMRHPNHTAAIAKAAGGAVGSAGEFYGYFGCFEGGVMDLAGDFGWFLQDGSKDKSSPPEDVNLRELWMSLPVIDMMKKANGPPTDFEDFVSHEPTDPWWDSLGYIKDTDRFDVPTLHVNSWYDFGVDATLYLFNLFQTNSESQRAAENQFVIISPMPHCRSERATEETLVGEMNVGDARLDYSAIYLRWFDYWLKGEDNHATEMPHVQFYVMGRNEWASAPSWPPPEVVYTPYYFHSDGRANSRFGTGSLSIGKPSDEPPDRFFYDPKTPVPSYGGPDCCTGSEDQPPGAFDQSDIEMRHDVLVYSTPILQKGIEVTGPVEAVLYVSSSVKDTDFTGKLVDVHPDGTAYNILEGIQRARYREGFDKKVWMEPGEVYEVRVKLHATSIYFAPGHRIRLEISSSNFPRFERNLNTGGNNYDETEWVIAENAIHHSATYPSHILLPVIPE